jgi:hypothetical protein
VKHLFGRTNFLIESLLAEDNMLRTVAARKESLLTDAAGVTVTVKGPSPTTSRFSRLTGTRFLRPISSRSSILMTLRFLEGFPLGHITGVGR